MIPAELRERRQWVVWQYESRDGKRTKVPYRVDTGERASTTDPTSWATFERAAGLAKQPGVDGVGFVFAPDDPFCGVDLDDCSANGELHPAAAAIVQQLATYSERSVSGRGVHAICRGRLNGFKRNRTSKTPWGGEFEVYDQARYFCMTGDRLPGSPDRLTDCQTNLERVLSGLFPPPASNGRLSQGPPSGRTDAEVLKRAFAASNGQKLQALYGGDASGYASHSEADLALCGALAYWTGPDPNQLDRLFRGSGLMRPKWGRPDYRDATLERALNRTGGFYDWEGASGVERTRRTSRKIDGQRVATGEGASVLPPERGAPTDAPAPVGAPTGASGPSAPLEFAQPVAEFVACKSEKPVALIGDDDETILPATGLMILFAKGGRGKTTLTVDLALHLASGIDWLGFTVARPLRVLFIENEGPREPFRSKLEFKLDCWEEELRGGFFVHTLNWGALTLADKEHAEALRAYVGAHEIDLVIGDPLDSLGIDGVGSPEDTRRFMELMSAVGLFRDVAFLLLHHPRKEGAADELDEVSGAWGGKPDTLLRLEKLEGNRSRLSFPKVRWSRQGTRPAYILPFDPETEGFSVAHQEGEKEERDYAAEIEALLSDGGWRTCKDIAAPKKDDGIGASETVLKTVLEQSPDRFVSRRGDAAKAVGRSSSAIVWQLAENEIKTLGGDLR